MEFEEKKKIMKMVITCLNIKPGYDCDRWTDSEISMKVQPRDENLP